MSASLFISAAVGALAPIQSPPVPQVAAQVEAEAPAGRAVLLDLPVELDGAYLGEVVARIAGDAVAVDVAQLVLLIDDRVDPESVAAVAALADQGEGFADLTQLAGAGLQVDYDSAELMLAVRPSVAQRGVRQLSVRPLSRTDPANGMNVPNFSAGATVVARIAHVQATPFGDTGLEPVSAEVFGFANLGGFEGWNLIYGADIDGARDRLVNRRDIALIHDDFDKATRLTIGDLRTRPLSGFQRSIDLVGVNYRRDYAAIQPFRTLLPRGRNFFTLERSARVRVEVDGVTVFDENLPPGGYDLRDFPFANGSNVATVTIDDGVGPPEVARISTFVDTELLAGGIDRFDVSAGFISNGFAARQRYEDEFAIVAAYDRGVTDQLTLGAYFEASREIAQFGTSAALGTDIGLFEVETAASHSKGAGTGFSALAQYRTEFQTGGWFNNIFAQASHRSQGYVGLAGQARRETNFDLRWVGQRGQLSLNADASHRRSPAVHTTTASLAAGFQLFGLRWRARYQGRWSNVNRTEHRGLLSVTIPLGKRSRLRGRVGSEGDARIEFQRYAGFDIGATQIRAAIDRSDGLYGGSAQIRHIGNRFEVELDHQTRETSDGVFSRSEATAAFGVGYADGSLQIGRPFDAGFVIVRRHDTISDNRVSVREGGLGVTARSDSLGDAFVPLRSSYSRYQFGLEVDDVEAGYDLGSGTMQLVPGFRSGYTFDIGSAGSATVVARLLAVSGEPVSLATGTVSDDAEEVARFFTNRTGRMVVEGLAPGRYRVRLDGADGAAASFAVDEGMTGYVQLDDIQLEP
ncbi:MAG: fimbria/pilus outer membrane usher protein [Pontixanthobacter sp.]